MEKSLGLPEISSYFISWQILLNVYFFFLHLQGIGNEADCSFYKEILFLGLFD